MNKYVLFLGVCLTYVIGYANASEIALSDYGYFSANSGSLFGYFDPEGSTGSGVFQPFLRFTSWGYNTDGTTEKIAGDGTVGGVHTHSILLSDIPTVEYNNTTYLQFLLDANQSQKSFLDRWLSIDTVVISLQTAPDQDGYGSPSGYPGDSDGQVLFTLTDTIIFDSDVFNAGSGDGDLEMLIPYNLIPQNPNPWLYLWTETGLTPNPDPFEFTGDWEDYNASLQVNAGNTASYEEWGVLGEASPPPGVPAPGALLLTSLGTLAFGYFRKRSSL